MAWTAEARRKAAETRRRNMNRIGGSPSVAFTPGVLPVAQVQAMRLAILRARSKGKVGKPGSALTAQARESKWKSSRRKGK